MFQHRRHNRLRVNPRHLELETQAVGLSSCFREATMEPCEKRQYTQVFPMTRGILLLVYLTVIAPPVFAQANSFLRQLQRSGLVQEDINIMAHAGSIWIKLIYVPSLWVEESLCVLWGLLKFAAMLCRVIRLQRGEFGLGYILRPFIL